MKVRKIRATCHCRHTAAGVSSLTLTRSQAILAWVACRAHLQRICYYHHALGKGRLGIIFLYLLVVSSALSVLAVLCFLAFFGLIPWCFLKSQEKGVLAKGVSVESSVTAKETKSTQGYWAQAPDTKHANERKRKSAKRAQKSAKGRKRAQKSTSS